MQDLRKLHEAIKMLFEEFGIKDPAFIISFTEPKTDYQRAFYISNISSHNSIKVLDSVKEKIKTKSN